MKLRTFMETYFKIKDLGRLNVKRLIKTYHADTNQTIAGEVI